MPSILLSLWLREGPHRRWAHRDWSGPAVPRAGDRLRTAGVDEELTVEAVTWDVESGDATVDVGALDLGPGERRAAAVERLREAGWTVAEAEHETPEILKDAERDDERARDGEAAPADRNADEDAETTAEPTSEQRPQDDATPPPEQDADEDAETTAEPTSERAG